MQNNPPTYNHKRPHVASSVRSFCGCLRAFPIVVRLSRFSIRTFPISIRTLPISIRTFPIFYVRNRHPALRHSRFASAYCQRPAPAGRATRARRSCDPRPRVAGLLGGGNGNCGNKNENRGTLFAGVSHCEEMYRTLFARCEYNDDGTSAVSRNTIFSHEHEDNCIPKIAPLSTHPIHYG